ncbi:MAG: dGTPase [Endozoicomonas sp. (ex Botrylloides leachii)]|nr:dGTPase [Endozoicomonas sp. (ex Botrylloides leachii)]
MNYLTKISTLRSQATSLNAADDLIQITESDRDRIIQSAAIRRLQQKTQVYPLETNAGVRSRLTHSLEVQQVGRTLSRLILAKLKRAGELDKFSLSGIETAFTNLVEMGCLMHDIGNPPFGHFGEETISQWLIENVDAAHRHSIKNGAGHTEFFYEVLLPDLCTFEGNAQGLRITHTLQNLNLTYSQLAAMMKYTRSSSDSKPCQEHPFYYRYKKPGFYYSEQELVFRLRKELDISKGCRFPLVYIMEAADDIAYCISDLEDAVDKGILSLRELQVCLKEVWSELDTNGNDYLPTIVNNACSQGSQFIVHLRSHLIKDLVEYAANRYLQNHRQVFDGVIDEPLIDGGSDQHLALRALKMIATRNIFNSPEKETPELRGHAALMGLMTIYRPLLELPREQFEAIAYNNDARLFIQQRLYHRLSKKYKAAYCQAIEKINKDIPSKDRNNDLEWYYRARLIIDYISGMTDQFVMTEYQKLSAI